MLVKGVTSCFERCVLRVQVRSPTTADDSSFATRDTRQHISEIKAHSCAASATALYEHNAVTRNR